MRACKTGKFALFLVFCLLSILLFAGNAHALMLEFSFEELVEGADTIVVGTVEDSISYWNDEETNIYTFVTVSVEDISKGSIDNETITIITRGGTVGDITQWVEDEPFFVKGDTVGLFLADLPAPKLAEMGLNNIVQLQAIKTPFSVYGLFQGKLPINDNLLEIESGISQDDFIGDVNLVQAGQSVPDRKLLPEVQGDTINQVITSITPNIGSAGTGTEVTVSGSGFGTRGSNDHLLFYYKTDLYHNFMASEILSWSDSQIRAIVPFQIIGGYPYSAASGPVAIFKDGDFYSPTPFTVTFGTSGWRWSGSNPVATYFVNPAGVSARNTAIQTAANSWNNAGANFTFNYGGTTTKTTIGQDGENVVIWTELPAGVLGQATMFNSGGYITEADFAFNTLYDWSTSATCPAGYLDVETVAIHELGHWLLLLDLYGNYPGYPQDVDKVMYGIGSDGTTKRNLHAHDILGIEWIYGTGGAAPPDLLVSFTSGTWWYGPPANWERLTPSTAHALTYADINNDGNLNLVASFDSGTWYVGPTGKWVRLTPSRAMAMSGIDDFLIISFSSGTWEYWQGRWYRITTSVATAITHADMAPDGYLNPVFSFNSGTWYIEWVSGGWRWVRLSSSAARALEGFGPLLYASFPSGTWEYYKESWGRLSTSTAHAIALADATGDGFLNHVMSFPSGTWYIVSSGSSLEARTAPAVPEIQSWSWSRLSPSTARALQRAESLNQLMSTSLEFDSKSLAEGLRYD